MNKIETVMELYKGVYPHVEIKQNGTWIKINHGGFENRNGWGSYRSNDLLEEIFRKTGNVWEWDSEWKIMRNVAAHSDTLWDTKDCWDTGKQSIMPQVATNGMYDKKPEDDAWGFPSRLDTKEIEENLFDDIGEV